MNLSHGTRRYNEDMLSLASPNEAAATALRTIDALSQNTEDPNLQVLGLAMAFVCLVQRWDGHQMTPLQIAENMIRRHEGNSPAIQAVKDYIEFEVINGGQS